MRPSKVFSLGFSLILLATTSFIAKADTFYITGAGVNGQEAVTFAIPYSSTPDFLSGDNFSFSNVPVTLLQGYGPEPPAANDRPRHGIVLGQWILLCQFHSRVRCKRRVRPRRASVFHC